MLMKIAIFSLTDTSRPATNSPFASKMSEIERNVDLCICRFSITRRPLHSSCNSSPTHAGPVSTYVRQDNIGMSLHTRLKKTSQAAEFSLPQSSSQCPILRGIYCSQQNIQYHDIHIVPWYFIGAEIRESNALHGKKYYGLSCYHDIAPITTVFSNIACLSNGLLVIKTRIIAVVNYFFFGKIIL